MKKKYCNQLEKLIWIIPFVVAFCVYSGIILAQEPPVPPKIDDQTSGSWMGTYGECSYVLGAYNAGGNCEIPILDGEDQCLPPTCYWDPVLQKYVPYCGGNYVGGASQDIVDCFSQFDLNGDGTNDFGYKAYAGPNFNSGRILMNPDGKCSGIAGAWVSAQWWNGCPTGADDNMNYTISGVPAGQYTVSVYVLDYDYYGRKTNIWVSVGGVASDVASIENYGEGVYVKFHVNIAPGENVTIFHDAYDHTPTSANAVVSGVFFDPYSGAMCANGKACYAGIGSEDLLSKGNWLWTYGKAGYIIFDRLNVGGWGWSCIPSGVPDPHTLVGGFAGAVSVVPNDNFIRGYWANFTPDPSCGLAMAWIWQCNDSINGRGLENPDPANCGEPNCAGGWVASTWDDAGEKQVTGPDLFVDIEVTLPGKYELSVYAVDYDYGGGCKDAEGNPVHRQQTYHLYDYHSYNPVFPPVPIGTFENGKYVTYTLDGPFKLTLRAEATYECYPHSGPTNAIISGIFIDPVEGYTCAGTPEGPECPNPIEPGDFCTYTIGGWGAPYQGNNPGTIRDDNWNTVYPPAVVGDSDGDGYGDLVIGSLTCKTMTFTDPFAVMNYLPCGGTPKALSKSMIDPDCEKTKGKNPEKNTFANQVLGLRLNMDYSCAGVLPEEYGDLGEACLGDLVITQGPFMGMSVRAFLAEAELALSCGTLRPGLTITDYYMAATAINENFDGCEGNNGYLDCPNPPPQMPCELHITKDPSATQDLNGDQLAPDVYPGDHLSFTLNVEAGACDFTNVTVTDVLPTFTIDGVTYDYYFVDTSSVHFIPAAGQTWSYNDATNTFTFNLGNILAGNKVTIIYDVDVNMLAPVGSSMTNTATVTGMSGGKNYTDNDSATVYIIVPSMPPYPPTLTSDIGTPGFWCNHLDQSFNNAFDMAQIAIWLWDINASSRYFNDLTYQSALDIVCNTKGSDMQKLERHLLVLWFNVASFNIWTDIKLGQLCVGAVPFPGDANMNWTIGEVITYAESELLDSSSTPYDYLFWKNVCDAINNSDSPVDRDGDGINGLQNDPVVPFDSRFDGKPCDATP